MALSNEELMIAHQMRSEGESIRSTAGVIVFARLLKVPISAVWTEIQEVDKDVTWLP